jgi:hypothetical protein
MGDLENERIFFPNVDFRYTIGPSEALSPGPVPLDMSRENLDRNIAIGQKDGRNAVKLGPGKYRDLLLNHYNQKEMGQSPVLSEMIDKALTK